MTSDPEEAGGRSRLWRLAALAVLLAIPCAVIWWPGCRQYPPVTSREALSAMKLLYAACNTRDKDRLDRVERDVEKLTREGKLSPPEQEAFARIIGTARKGDWEDAERASLKFAEDQVGRGSSEPATRDHEPAKKK